MVIMLKYSKSKDSMHAKHVGGGKKGGEKKKKEENICFTGN